MTNVGYATLSVIPSARGFGPALSRDVDPQMHAPGVSAGRVLGLGLLAGAAVVVAGIGAVIKTGIGEAMDASAGTAQLTAGIASTGNAANVTVGGLNDLASSIQGYSGQTDDSIVASQALLLTFTNIRNGVGEGNDIFDQATVATANMAARMGGDAASSAIQLGKALNDPVAGMASLGRMGVQFTDAQKETIAALVETGDVAGAQKVILAELETQFGGAAAAAGDSLPGQLEIAKRSFEDVSQSVAEGLLPMILPGLTSIGTTITTTVIPAITGFIQGFKDGEGPGGTFRDVLDRVGDVAGTIGTAFQTYVMPALSTFGSYITGTVIPGVASFVGWLRQNAEWLTPIAVGIGAMVVAFTAYNAVMTVVRVATAAYAVVQGILNVAMSANPIGIVVLAIVGLVAALVYAWNNSETFRNVVTGVWTAIQTGVMAVVDWFTTAIPAAFELVKNAFLNYTPLGLIISHWGQIQAAVASVVAWLRAAPGAAFAWIKNAFLTYTPLGIIISHWDQIKTSIGTAIDGAITFVREMPGRIVDGLGNLGSLLYDAGKNVIQGLINGITNKVSSAVQAVKDAVSSVINGAKDLLGINSPSRVFTEIGAYTGEGFALGITGQQGAAQAAMRGLVAAPGLTAPGADVGRSANGRADAGSTFINITADVSRLRSVAELEAFFSNLRVYARQSAGVGV